MDWIWTATILRHWTVAEASYSHRHWTRASHLKFKKLRMLLVAGKYQLPLLGFRKWNWILFVLLIKDCRRRNTIFSGYFGAINFCLAEAGKRWGKMILEILEAEITYHCKRTGVENPLNKRCEITLWKYHADRVNATEINCIENY